MLKTLLVLILSFGLADSAKADCPAQPISLCQMVSASPVVVRAKVEAVQRIVDEDDPEGVAGWIYHLDVIEHYRHGTGRRLTVISENTAARVSLEVGNEYIVFAAPNSEGQLETGNFCDPYSSKEFDRTTARNVLSCLSNEKAGRRK